MSPKECFIILFFSDYTVTLLLFSTESNLWIIFFFFWKIHMNCPNELFSNVCAAVYWLKPFILCVKLVSQKWARLPVIYGLSKSHHIRVVLGAWVGLSGIWKHQTIKMWQALFMLLCLVQKDWERVLKRQKDVKRYEEKGVSRERVLSIWISQPVS